MRGKRSVFAPRRSDATSTASPLSGVTPVITAEAPRISSISSTTKVKSKGNRRQCKRKLKADASSSSSLRRVKADALVRHCWFCNVSEKTCSSWQFIKVDYYVKADDSVASMDKPLSLCLCRICGQKTRSKHRLYVLSRFIGDEPAEKVPHIHPSYTSLAVFDLVVFVC